MCGPGFRTVPEQRGKGEEWLYFCVGAGGETFNQIVLRTTIDRNVRCEVGSSNIPTTRRQDLGYFPLQVLGEH